MVQPRGSLSQIASCPTQSRGGKCFKLYSGTREKNEEGGSAPDKQKVISAETGSCRTTNCPERTYTTNGNMRNKQPITRGKVCAGCYWLRQIEIKARPLPAGFFIDNPKEIPYSLFVFGNSFRMTCCSFNNFNHSEKGHQWKKHLAQEFHWNKRRSSSIQMETTSPASTSTA